MKEERLSIRYVCDVAHSSYQTGKAVKREGQLRNISLGGCYFATRETAEAGTHVQIEFACRGKRLVFRCVVRHAQPGEGMGLEFVSAETPAAISTLSAWIQELRAGHAETPVRERKKK